MTDSLGLWATIRLWIAKIAFESDLIQATCWTAELHVCTTNNNIRRANERLSTFRKQSFQHIQPKAFKKFDYSGILHSFGLFRALLAPVSNSRCQINWLTARSGMSMDLKHQLLPFRGSFEWKCLYKIVFFDNVHRAKLQNNRGNFQLTASFVQFE